MGWLSIKKADGDRIFSFFYYTLILEDLIFLVIKNFNKKIEFYDIF